MGKTDGINDITQKELTTPLTVWLQTWHLLAQDVQYKRRQILNIPEQKGVYDSIMNSVEIGTGDVYFVYGYGAHSRFHIPINIDETSTCSISAQSDLGALLIKVLKLTKNMRLNVGARPEDVTEIREFAEWILKVGDGELEEENDGVSEQANKQFHESSFCDKEDGIYLNAFFNMSSIKRYYMVYERLSRVIAIGHSHARCMIYGQDYLLFMGLSYACFFFRFGWFLFLSPMPAQRSNDDQASSYFLKSFLEPIFMISGSKEFVGRFARGWKVIEFLFPIVDDPKQIGNVMGQRLWISRRSMIHLMENQFLALSRNVLNGNYLALSVLFKALCLDVTCPDHRPILLREVSYDFGYDPFRFYPQSWLRMEGFDSGFKKKLQDLKSIIRLWVKDKKFHLHNAKNSLQNDLISIDKDLERGNVSDDILLNRMDLNRRLQDIKLLEVKDLVQKSKIKWAIEGDENSKFFHGIINKKRSQLSIRGVFVEGTWCTDPSIVKEAFKNHFEVRFQQPCHDRLKLNAPFHNRLSSDQVDELDRAVSRDEIRRAVWNCGENKSPGPDGYTFEFFRKYWSLVGADFCDAVDYFFKSGTFPRGCNSSFIALIPKVNDAKFVNDFRPISLIGCVYKVITKVLANRLATVISDLVSETQSAFVANRQILDGPFILNEMLNWCKRKKKQAMFFKVDFAKAYDSVRWDYLLDILHAFGFGPNWCRWIRGTFTSSMASILVNGSPTSEFPFCCGLKQGDPLAPYLFILIMESLHISFSRVVDDGLFKGFQLHGSVNISHLFYADDAMFIGEWSEQNLHNIVKVLNCFHLASGLKINIAKSQVLGVGVSQNVVVQAANRIGCAVLNTPFRYLGVTVGECMSRKSAWVGLVNKLQARLSKWKVKTLSIGGRLTLLKSVLGASPIYYMSIFKVPKGVLKTMESIRSKFFNGVDSSDRKISWVAWDNVLASKLNGGLGVSSFFALNRALLLKWVWRFISGDGSLWCKVIQAIYGSKFDLHVTDQPSIWCSILREVKSLKDSGFDFSSHCKKRIGDGSCTSFWYDIWLADAPLCVQFPRLFALELDKEIVVANKMGASSVSASFRRDVRDGAERQQWDDLSSIMNSVVLSSSKDRWTCDLSGDGEFKVKVIRNFIDDLFLPSSDVATRWVKFIPIKVNVFSWRARRDRLPTRVNLSRRGVLLDSHLCPLCNAAMEDVQHVFFRCDVARVVLRKICRWWDLDWQEICSFSDWDAWFLSFRLSSRLKSILEAFEKLLEEIRVTWTQFGKKRD
ncbi:RNA-directed DNA polymerase, eukaryota [Tanacetum coccineum]